MYEEAHTNKKQLFILALLGIAIVVGALVVMNRVIFQNRAASPEVPVGTGGACMKNVGTCSVGSPMPPGTELVVYNTADPANPVARGRGPELTFDAIDGASYQCSIQTPDKKCSSSSNVVTPSSCGGPTGPVPTTTITPVVTPPTDECTDCVDGKFVCSEPTIIKQGSNPACPALSIQHVKYEQPNPFACPNNPPPTGLDCKKHLVFLETIPGFNRQLSEQECEEVKADTFDLRLHTGLVGQGCRTYQIKAYVKNPDGSSGEEIKICDTCDLKVSCPTTCEAPVAIKPKDLKDIPDLPEDANECVPGVCDLTVVNSCGPETTINTNIVSPDGGRLYFDDPHGDPPRTWENVPGGQSSRTHTYKNTGYYDIVLVCKNPNSTPGSPDQNFVCAKRITRTCNQTPPPPSPTPPLSCPDPVLEVKLILTCPEGKCPTPTTSGYTLPIESPQPR